MANSRTVGSKLGSLSAKGAAKAWGLTCRIASATGEFGEGFVEGAETGWEAECAAEEIRVQARLVASEAARAKRVAAYNAAKAALVDTSAPKMKAAKAA